MNSRKPGRSRHGGERKDVVDGHVIKLRFL